MTVPVSPVPVLLALVDVETDVEVEEGVLAASTVIVKLALLVISSDFGDGEGTVRNVISRLLDDDEELETSVAVAAEAEDGATRELLVLIGCFLGPRAGDALIPRGTRLLM